MSEQEQIQKQEKWAVTEQDVRSLCEKWEIPFPILIAAHKNLARGSKDIGVYEVLYVMGQAKVMGLPPFGNWYVIIPPSQKQKDKGITGGTPCFKIDAALYILSHHDNIEPGSEEHYWTGGDGTHYDAEHPPAFKKVRETDLLPKIDFDLTCTVSVTLKKGGKKVSRTISYREWAKDTTNSYSMWIIMPSHMTWKQCAKELVRMHFGGGLWEDEATGMVDVTPATLAPAQEKPQLGTSPTSIPASTQELDEHQQRRLSRLTHVTGLSETTLRAAMKEATGHGMSADDFLYQAETGHPTSNQRHGYDDSATLSMPVTGTKATIDVTLKDGAIENAEASDPSRAEGMPTEAEPESSDDYSNL